MKNQIEIKLPCGCYFGRSGKSRSRWTLCNKAKELQNLYEEDFKNRPNYDEHFSNQRKSLKQK